MASTLGRRHRSSPHHLHRWLRHARHDPGAGQTPLPDDLEQAAVEQVAYWFPAPGKARPAPHLAPPGHVRTILRLRSPPIRPSHSQILPTLVDLTVLVHPHTAMRIQLWNLVFLIGFAVYVSIRGVFKGRTKTNEVIINRM